MTELIRMFVDVPINVQTPPNMAAKERGISTRVELMFASRAALMSTGMKIATTAVFEMAIEISPMPNFIVAIAAV